MASQAQDQRVLIIGAGLAGLALAQSLKHSEPPIPFHIFERDASTSFRSQGYRIRIFPNGAAALQKLLPPHLWDTFEATCAPVAAAAGPGPGFRINALDAAAPEGPSPQFPRDAMRNAPQFMEGKSYNADRTVLRNVLLSGLEDCISFEKRFTEYYTTPDGGVEVRFEDGSSARGSILVGADGAHSAVRRQLLPGFIVLDTEQRALFGKSFLTPELRQRVPEEMTEGMCIVAENPNSPFKMLCDLMKFEHLDPARKTRYHVPADYIYWVLLFRKDTYPGDDSTLLGFTHAESAQLSLKLTESWHERIRALLEGQDEESASTLAFHTCTYENFKERWESLESQKMGDEGAVTLLGGPVTLLGDAAHPMAPVGGVGANSAFQEAADLSEAMAKVYRPSEAWEKLDALIEYQGLMRERGEATLKRSIAGSGHLLGTRPVEELKPVA